MDRDEFMELVYETFADEPDNVLANGIIEAADAYAEHEKAQLSKEGTTSDLIDRQAAIDALDCINGTEEVLRSLPSAQPEYEEVTPEEATSEIASRSIMSAWSWFNVMIQLKQMGYAICRKK